MKKNIIYCFVISMVFALALSIGNASAELKVLTVPFVASNPLIPHDTYNGVPTTFMAIARGGTGTYAFEWDVNGDGIFDYSNTTANPYNLSWTFTYPPQASDRLFIATIKVTSGAETATAEYRVLVHEPAVRQVKVNRAIDNALWFLHVNMNRNTTGGVAYGNYPTQTLAAAGMAAQAFEIQGHKANGNYDTNPYVEDVQRCLNYCLIRTSTVAISPQPAGDPDANGNGIGLISSLQSAMYETGIVLMALANCGDPLRSAEAGLPTNIAGRTYKDIVQDMADLLAFGQTENSVWRGGWRYAPNSSDSDMSVTQWPVIGLEAAESNEDFKGLITVPGWVKTELRDHFLSYDQGADGGFGYAGPGSNIPRTGAGLACQAWVGLSADDPKVIRAVNYLNNTWSWGGCDGNIGNFYSMYAVNKGMRGFTPDIEMIGSHDWYAEYADWLIAHQVSDGRWNDNCRFDVHMATAAGVLILVPGIIEPQPVAVAKASPKEAPPGAIITFDHSGSYHNSATLKLVKFRWDFDNDGIWDYETDDINAKPTWVYNDIIGCGDEVIHLVTLEVEDEAGKTDQDNESVIIKINLFNHPPVAIGDPTPSAPNYEVSKGSKVLLDASSSYDPDTGIVLKCDPTAPDDFIVKYEWDLDNDGVFDVEGKTFLFDTPDDWEFGSTHTVQLRVTDDGTWAGPGGGGSKSGETTVTIIVIQNQPPVAKCTNVTVEADSTCQGSASIDDGSYDPDGDPITCVQTPSKPYPFGETSVVLTCTDSAGTSSSCSGIVNVVDSTLPQITIITPQANVALQDGVTLQAQATDNCGVEKAYFFLREPDGGEGIPIGYEDLAATFNTATGYWEYPFDTTVLQDGYYVILAKAIDKAGNEGISSVVVPFSIRNWAEIEMLPATPNNKAGRTMPVKFSLRIAASVDPAQPFVYNEDLEIRIYRCDNTSCSSKTLMQTSVYGSGSTNYRINDEKYITNFQTTKTPAQYLVEKWRPSNNFMIGSFTFKTVK